MSTIDLIDEVTSLPVEQRAVLVDSLLRSLNAPSEEIDRKWTEIARRRLQELRSGEQAVVPGDEVFGRIWKRFE